MLVDFNLATLTAADLRMARLIADRFATFAETRAEPALGRVARSLRASLEAETVGREAGRGRGTVRVVVDAFEDDPADAAHRDRERAIGYLLIVRDDNGYAPEVRHLCACVLADLEDPTPTARAVEEIRLEDLSNGGSVW